MIIITKKKWREGNGTHDCSNKTRTLRSIGRAAGSIIMVSEKSGT